MKKLIVLIPILIYLGASTWASLDLFPDGFMEYWWFDDVMHIVVFGGVALALMYTAKHYLGRWWLGSLAAIALAALDELSQAWIPARSFDLHDLVMSVVGIAIAAMGYYVVQAVRQRRV